MKFLTQLNGTDSDKWIELEAPDSQIAALRAVRAACKFPASPFSLLPCEVYVSLTEYRHENGTPMAVQKYKIERTAKS